MRCSWCLCTTSIILYFNSIYNNFPQCSIPLIFSIFNGRGSVDLNDTLRASPNKRGEQLGDRAVHRKVGCVPGCGKTEARADTVKKQCTTPKRTKASYRSVKYVTAVIYGAALKP